jgi:hypothetical protein
MARSKAHNVVAQIWLLAEFGAKKCPTKVGPIF